MTIKFSTIVLQAGPVKEFGVNGDQVDDILEWCMNLLKELNVGPYKTNFTTQAIIDIESALDFLKARTDDRIKRGVEGTSNP